MTAPTRSLMIDQEMFFSSPPQLNDPFEFNPVLSFDSPTADWKKYAKKIVETEHVDKPRSERRHREKINAEDNASNRSIMSRSYRQTMDAIGVLSMSSLSDNVLMWPHYAENHHGLCVQLDFSALVASRNVPMFVTYRQERPIAFPITDNPMTMFHKAALTKGLPWSYEHEWRLVINRGGGKVLRLTQTIITGVILGARISADHKAEVLTWVAECQRPMAVS